MHPDQRLFSIHGFADHLTSLDLQCSFSSNVTKYHNTGLHGVQVKPTINLHGVKDKIAERLRELRHERGLSMSEVAQKTGLSFSHISKLETSGGNPGKGSLAMLATFYGVAMESFWGEQSPAAIGTTPKSVLSAKGDHERGIEDACRVLGDAKNMAKANAVADATGCPMADAMGFIVRQKLKGG